MTREPPNDGERKSTADYWDENWRRASDDEGVPSMSERDCYYWRRMERALEKSFAGLDASNSSLIEIGAGTSEWLPYLHHRFGFSVVGLDYSEVGCKRAQDNLARTSTPGNIYHADMFKPPTELHEKFDVVVSFGLVEHFSDTTSAIAACSAYAKPGGLIFTLIPNMSGLYGWLYRIFDRKVYDIHVPLTLKDLRKAHRNAGLALILDEHILGVPGVIDRQRVEPVLIRKLLRKVVFHFSRIAWALEERGWGVPENAFTSPYMVCVARKQLSLSSVDSFT
jgi:2-polyprenyl-3-methyl-5-hydroxy-6-metoxy-1,4-benzoquinol methylase